MLFISLARTQSVTLLFVALVLLAAGQITYRIAMRHANPNPRVTWNPKTWDSPPRLRARFADVRWFWWCVAGHYVRVLGMLVGLFVSYFKG